LKVNATDNDSEENARITYSLLGKTPGIRIVPETGVILATGDSARGRSPIKIAVIAQDHGKPPKRTVAAVRLRAPTPAQNKHIFTKDDYK